MLMWMIEGNTRLMVAKEMKIKPFVVIVEVKVLPIFL